MSEAMSEATDKAPASKKEEALELSHPNDLLSGNPFPMRDYVFRRKDGKRVKVRIQGLSYAVKSAEDRRDQAERTEAEARGLFKLDLRGPRLLAKAMRLPDGRPAFERDEDETVFAVSIAEQLPDGEINRAYNALMELSGYGKDAMKEAEKD